MLTRRNFNLSLLAGTSAFWLPSVSKAHEATYALKHALFLLKGCQQVYPSRTVYFNTADIAAACNSDIYQTKAGFDCIIVPDNSEMSNKTYGFDHSIPSGWAYVTSINANWHDELELLRKEVDEYRRITENSIATSIVGPKESILHVRRFYGYSGAWMCKPLEISA